MNHPKGILVAIGGAEDKGLTEDMDPIKNLNFFKEGILRRILDLAGKKEEPRIEIVTTASSIPDEVGRTYKKAFKKLGGIEVGHLKIASRDDADNKKTIERLEACNCIFFSGGDQLRLCSVLGGTVFLSILKERYQDEYFVIAGTSAGAAAMSTTMICGGPEERAYLKGEVQLNIGFGFLPNIIIDTHFDARGRFGRLAQAIATQPGEVGIGLDEDTGVIIEKGTRLKAIGSSSVIIIDGSSIQFNNIADIKTGQPISFSNLKVHLMANSDVYDVETHQFIAVKPKAHQK